MNTIVTSSTAPQSMPPASRSGGWPLTGFENEAVPAGQSERELAGPITCEWMRPPGDQFVDTGGTCQIVQSGPQLAGRGLAQYPGHQSLLLTELSEAIVPKAYFHQQSEKIIYLNGK